MMLAAPGGQVAIFMSDAGGCCDPITNVTKCSCPLASVAFLTWVALLLRRKIVRDSV